jgi:hypothetical protein
MSDSGPAVSTLLVAAIAFSADVVLKIYDEGRKLAS